MARIHSSRALRGPHEVKRFESKAAVPRLPPPRQLTVVRTIKGDGRGPRRVEPAVGSGRTSPGASPGQDFIIDHRQGRGRRVLALVDLVWRDGRRCGGLVHDIGLEGMYVLCTIAPADARCVEVRPAAATPVSIPGFVVHRRSHGIGLMFRDLDAAAMAFVRRCLR